jgi:uncharacterized protein (DUF2384 family)
MKPWEVGRIYALHLKLLLIFEPLEAMTWLMRPQKILGDRRPCEVLETGGGYHEVEDAVTQLTDGVFI